MGGVENAVNAYTLGKLNFAMGNMPGNGFNNEFKGNPFRVRPIE
jgi:hypothetical protein